MITLPHAELSHHVDGSAGPVTTREVSWTAPDGALLRGQWHAPDAPRYVSVLHSATAVPQTYYHAFARWLAARGHATLTWDYRGIGLSRRPGRLRRSSATMTQWVEQDAPSATQLAMQAHPGLPLFMLGHSMGGHAMMTHPMIHMAHASVLVACGSGDWRLALPELRLKRRVQVALLMPLLARTIGYIPGWTGTGEDLPGGVALEWSRRCQQPGYWEPELRARAGQNLGRLRADVLNIALSDDDYISPEAVHDLAREASRARMTTRTVSPAELGVDAVGHFRMFRPNQGAALWPIIAGWLEERA